MWVGGQRHAPAALPLGKIRYTLYRRLVVPQGQSGRVRRKSPPQGFDPRTVQPVASRYTEWAIPAHMHICSTINSYTWTNRHYEAHRRFWNLSLARYYKRTLPAVLWNTRIILEGSTTLTVVNNGTRDYQWERSRAVKPQLYFIWQFAFTLHPDRLGVTAGSAVTAAVPLCCESWALPRSSIYSSYHSSKKVLELFSFGSQTSAIPHKHAVRCMSKFCWVS